MDEGEITALSLSLDRHILFEAKKELTRIRGCQGFLSCSDDKETALPRLPADEILQSWWP
jgi:hypothetical protein